LAAAWRIGGGGTLALVVAGGSGAEAAWRWQLGGRVVVVWVVEVLVSLDTIIPFYLFLLDCNSCSSSSSSTSRSRQMVHIASCLSIRSFPLALSFLMIF
jgi:hypothetical protein